MAFVSPSTNIDFMNMRKFWITLSFLLNAFCVYLWIQGGPNKFGIDFRGGVDIVAKFDSAVSADSIRSAVSATGLDDATVQSFQANTLGDNSTEYSIRIKGGEKDSGSGLVKQALNTIGVTYNVIREEFVGPVIGEKIKTDGYKAIVISIIGLLIYITYRFEFYYALGAIISLAHDVFMAAGVFLFFGGEISGSVLAALLTILGYSVNDTIITYDRIRENLALRSSSGSIRIGDKSLKSFSFSDIINLSVNQTLSRTILTAGTVLFSCLSLWIFGGGAITDLAFVLTVGVIAGTYSSIFIAAPIVLSFHNPDKNAK
jgi:preprotein translocase subunit SecF